jgi:ankyrin repeat protein
MLAAGITPDARTSAGGSALINAAATGQDETAMLLISAGADVNAVDETNSSALLRATNRCGNGELIRALIKAGADVNVQAKGSATPMMMATVMNCAENQKLLRAAGAKEWKPGQ